jgi:hypothetical protein
MRAVHNRSHVERLRQVHFAQQQRAGWRFSAFKRTAAACVGNIRHYDMFDFVQSILPTFPFTCGTLLGFMARGATTQRVVQHQE